MTDDLIRWFHATSAEAEYASGGPFASREEAIADGKLTHGEAPFWITKGEKVTHEDLALWLAHQLREDCESGSWEEDAEIGSDDPIFEMTDEDEAALRVVLAAWARERNVLRPWWCTDLGEEYQP